MKTDKEELFEMINAITELINNNENADGTFKFDVLRAKIALDFTKTEIEKTISK